MISGYFRPVGSIGYPRSLLKNDETLKCRERAPLSRSNTMSPQSNTTLPGRTCLVWPSSIELPGYVAALRRGWSPDNLRPGAVQDELAEIASDPVKFLARLVDKEAAGLPIKLPDGSLVPRLPGYRRWIWDGEFCGSIGLRWRDGTSDLPSYCLGHIGYSVVPWKQGKGLATLALGEILPEASALGLSHVDITTDPDNIPSQRVILANGGILIERFRKPEVYGGVDGLRYRIDLR
jgi:predicted acetyltransferase